MYGADYCSILSIRLLFSFASPGVASLILGDPPPSPCTGTTIAGGKELSTPPSGFRIQNIAGLGADRPELRPWWFENNRK